MAPSVATFWEPTVPVAVAVRTAGSAALATQGLKSVAQPSLPQILGVLHLRNRCGLGWAHLFRK